MSSESKETTVISRKTTSSPMEIVSTSPKSQPVSASPTSKSPPVTAVSPKSKVPPLSMSPISKTPPTSGSPRNSPLPVSPTSRTSPLSMSPSGRPMLSKVRTLSQGSTSSGDWVSSPSCLSRTFSISSQSWGRHVVLALDSSNHARDAFDWFLEQIHRPDDMIVMVHCPEAPRLPTFSFKSGLAPPVDEWKKILDEMNERTRKLEEVYETMCIQRKLRYKVRGEAMKNAGEGIIKIAESEGAEMIVIGTRGMSTVKRALLGSVSDFVVRNSSIPVITVPKQKQPKQ